MERASRCSPLVEAEESRSLGQPMDGSRVQQGSQSGRAAVRSGATVGNETLPSVSLAVCSALNCFQLHHQA